MFKLHVFAPASYPDEIVKAGCKRTDRKGRIESCASEREIVSSAFLTSGIDIHRTRTRPCFQRMNGTEPRAYAHRNLNLRHEELGATLRVFAAATKHRGKAAPSRNLRGTRVNAIESTRCQTSSSSCWGPQSIRASSRDHIKPAVT